MEIKDNNQDNEKENTNKQYIGGISKENNEENNNTKEQIKSYKDKNNIITKSKSANNIKDIKIINKPNLNYDYGDSIDSIFFNEITNTNIKYNINTTNEKIEEVINNNKYKNDEINNNNANKIIDIKHNYLSNKKNNIDLSGTKPYYNLYYEFKNKYKNNNEIQTLENNSLSQRTYFTNYISNSVQRNYLTLNPHNTSNNLSYNILENQFKTPLRNESENKSNNIILNFSDYKINSYTPNKYFNINNNNNNNNKNDIDSAKNIYLEKQISEQQKIIKKYENVINIYMNEIKIYKNSFKIISDFFDLISKKYIPEINYKNKVIEINDENMLNTYFKKLEEYITNINKELNDYKYKYKKLLDLDSSLHLTTNKENKINNENKNQNIFLVDNDIINEKYMNNFDSTNSNNEIDIYRTLEQRVLVLENELFNNKKINEKNANIKNKSSNKILIKYDKKKKTNEDKYNNHNIKVKVNKNNNFMSPSIKNSKINLNNKNKTIAKNKLCKSSRQKKK